MTKPYFWAVALFIVCLCGGELALRQPALTQHLPPAVLSADYDPFNAKYHELRHFAATQGTIDCLFLGSSLVLNGIHIDQFAASFKAQTGESITCFNFGLGFLTPSTAAPIAEMLIATYHPKLLIYGITTRDFRTHPEIPEYVIQEGFPQQPWLQYQAGHFNGRGWALEQFYLYRYYLTFGKWLNPVYSGFFSGNAVAPNGYEVLAFYRKSSPHYQAPVPLPALPPWTLPDDDRAGLARLEKLPLILLEMPLSDHYKQAFFGDIQTHTQVLTQVFAQFPARPVWRTTDLNFLTADDWSDPIHLYVIGALKFSDWLGQQIGAAWQQNAWSQPPLDHVPLGDFVDEGTYGLTPALFAEFQAREGFEGNILNPASNTLSRESLLISQGIALSWDADLTTAEKQTAWELMRALEAARYQPELNLTSAQTEALTAWRNSKNPADLRHAGFEYLLYSDYWLSFQSPAELASLNDPSAYRLVNKWWHSGENMFFYLIAPM